MRRRIKQAPMMFFAAILFTLMLNVLPVNAEDDIQRVYDYADLLTDSEEANLEQEAEKYSAKRDINYLIVTTEDPTELVKDATYTTDEERTEAYSNIFYNNFISTYGNTEEQCTILTIDMSERIVDVAGNGLDGEIFNQSRRDLVREKITPLLSNGNYYDAFSKYIKLTNSYIGVKEGMNPESPFLKLWFQALVAICIGSIVVIIMVFNLGGRMTVDQGTYLDQKDSRILARKDLYLRTTLTRVRKPQTNSNGGSGGGGGGSNGHSSGRF